MTPCTAPRCRDAARWAVGPDDRQLCRRHMLDALLASGFGQAYAVPLAAEQTLRDRLVAAATGAVDGALAELLLEAADAVDASV
jgi:hypothetical protein